MGLLLENSPKENWGITFSRLRLLNADAVASTHIDVQESSLRSPRTLSAAAYLYADQTIS